MASNIIKSRFNPVYFTFVQITFTLNNIPMRRIEIIIAEIS